MDYKKIVEDDSEIRFYRHLHKKILSYLANKQHSTFWEIIREVGGSDRRVLRLLNQMQLAKEIRLENRRIFSLSKKTGNGFINFSEIRKFMSKFYKEKPNPTFLYDQRPVTLDTTVNRAEYILRRGDLIGKRIAVIGDDDLTSLAIGLIRLAKEVVVFDIDDRLVRFINQIAKREELNITAYSCDFTSAIPKKFSRKFDVFLTDPTPNPESFSLFISVGLNLLKKGKRSAGYVSFFPSHQDISIDFQKILTNKGVIITDMIHGYTEYDFIKETYKPIDIELLKKFDSKSKKLSFTENLTRFETTEETIKEKDRINKKTKNRILGKATRRVLRHIEKDPAYIKGESNFVLSLAEKLRRGLND